MLKSNWSNTNDFQNFTSSIPLITISSGISTISPFIPTKTSITIKTALSSDLSYSEYANQFGMMIMTSDNDNDNDNDNKNYLNNLNSSSDSNSNLPFDWFKLTNSSTTSTTYLSNNYSNYLNKLQWDDNNINITCNLNINDGSGMSSPYFKIVVYFLYISIFLFALIGNGSVCYIVQSTPRMRTVTNYFIANLAVGDILMSLFCVPFSFVSIFILSFWPFGIVLCHLVNYSQAVSVLVSAYTLVAISVDRYIAIMWPLRPRITKRYAKCIIAVVWLIALATALPILLVSQLYKPPGWHTKCDKYICREFWPSQEQNYYYTLALLTLQFVIPLAVLIFTYTRIAIAVWGKRPPGEAENSRDQRMARSKRKMIKMMVTVVIVFTICWLPFNILVLLLNDELFVLWEPLPYFWFAFHWLAMSHSCYNPIIYCYMNARFRGGFLQVVHRIPGLRHCWCIRKCARGRSGSMGTGFQLTGEKNVTNFGDDDEIGDVGGGGGGGDDLNGLKRKSRVQIRNRRYFSSSTSKHLHNLCQHKKKTQIKCKPAESVFVCRDYTSAVIPKVTTEAPTS